LQALPFSREVFSSLLQGAVRRSFGGGGLRVCVEIAEFADMKINLASG